MLVPMWKYIPDCLDSLVENSCKCWRPMSQMVVGSYSDLKVIF